MSISSSFCQRAIVIALAWGAGTGCGFDMDDAAADADGVNLEQPLSELSTDDAQALCARFYVDFGREKGLQCDGVMKENPYRDFDRCVAELDASTCAYTVKQMRSCREPLAGGSRCDFVSDRGCVDLMSDCGLSVTMR